MASIGRLAALNGTCCEESQETMKSELHQVFYRESQENGINIRCGSHHIRDKFSLQEDENRPYHHFEIDFPTKVSKDVVDMRVKLILKRLMGRTEHIVYPCKVVGTTHSFFNVLPMDLKSSLEELLADDEEAQQALSVVCEACMQGTRAGELTSIARTSIRLKLCVHMMCTCRYVVLQENQNWKCLYQEVKNFLRKDLKGDKQTIREAQRTLMKAGEAISTSDGRLETGTNPRLSFDPRQDASASRGTSKRQRNDGLQQDDDVSPRSLVRPKMVPGGDGSGDTSEQNASDEGAFDTSPDSVLPQPTCQGTPAAESLPGFNGILPRRPDALDASRQISTGHPQDKLCRLVRTCSSMLLQAHALGLLSIDKRAMLVHITHESLKKDLKAVCEKKNDEMTAVSTLAGMRRRRVSES